MQRTSFAVVFNREDNQTYEATVDLTGDAVAVLRARPRRHPELHRRRVPRCRRCAAGSTPTSIAALAERGFTDMSLVLIDVWTYGKALMPEQHRHRRLGWCDLWARRDARGKPVRAIPSLA